MSELTLQFGDNLRTQADWVKAGPTDLFRLNAEVYAASHEIAGVALDEGGVMIYYRRNDDIMDASLLPDAKVINP